MIDIAKSERIESGVIADTTGLLDKRRVVNTFGDMAEGKAVSLVEFSSDRREQQLRAKACVAFAFAKAMEVWTAANRGVEAKRDISVLFLWYIARQMYKPDGVVENTGVSLEAAIHAIESLGVTEEKHWPWKFSDIYATPRLKVLRDAYTHRVALLARPILRTGKERVAAIHAALQQKKPVVFSYGMPNSWLAYSRYNLFLNDVLNTEENIDFYHAMVILGYDVSRDAFIFENSFGSIWGYNGFGFISSSLIALSKIDSYWVVEAAPKW